MYPTTFLLTLLASFGLDFSQNGQKSGSPEQVHLSLGRDVTEMVVTWITQGHDVIPSEVQVKKTSPESFEDFQVLNFEGQGYAFDAGNETTRFISIHHARMTGLQPKTEYQYRIQQGNKETQWYSFRSTAVGSETMKIAFYGDLGVQGGKSHKAVAIDLIKKLVDEKQVHVILHVGDFAYDLADKEGKKGDKFFNMIQPIASRVPYQVVAGNHEQEPDLSYNHYNHRFNMIGSDGKVNNFFYSFNLGLIHVIALNSEYHADDEEDKMAEQYKFLEKDLILANEMRATRPWIVVMMHHPLYCKQKNSEECTEFKQFKLLRKETNLEELFYKYGVDVTLSGHEHVYKRTFPVFRDVVCSSNTSVTNPYDNPRGPIHFTSGVSGRLSKLLKFKCPFTAFGLEKYGINLIHSVTKESMTIDFIEHDGVIGDRINIINKNILGKRYSCPEAEETKIPKY